MNVAAHARALVRRRRGLAVAIAELEVSAAPKACAACNGSRTLRGAWTYEDGRRGSEAVDCPMCEASGSAAVAVALAILRHPEQGFDVARARAYATALIALEDEHAVFTEWTVSRGKGPDNREPGAFGGCGHCRGSGTEPKGPLSGHCEPPDCYACDGLGDEKPGGWPGKLAREWGTVPCGACGGSRSRLIQDPMTGGLSTTRLWCSDCKGRGHTAKPGADRRAPQGRSLARVGRRLLEALEGQPSECQNPRCENGSRQYSVGKRGPCSICRGTGHNLAGYLPEVDWPARIRRKVCDSLNAHRGGSWESWTHMLTIEQESLGWLHGTRVVPRGEHRADMDIGAVAEMLICTLDERIHARGWQPNSTYRVPYEVPLAHGHSGPRRRTLRMVPIPRWRRGELLHAQQRRERDAPRAATGEHLDELGAVFDRERRQDEPDDEYRGRLLEAQGAALGRGSLTQVTQSLTQTPAREG